MLENIWLQFHGSLLANSGHLEVLKCKSADGMFKFAATLIIATQSTVCRSRTEIAKAPTNESKLLMKTGKEILRFFYYRYVLSI